MPKVVLIDADGVVVKKTSEYFSERFAREYGAPNAELQEFFKNEFRQCQRGKLDIKEILTPRLPTWGWDRGVDEFLTYWFTTDVVVDEEVMAVVKEWRAKGVECYLATDQEQHRKDYIVNLLDGQFDGFWFSCDLGFSKSQPEFFKEILRRWDMRYKPQEIMFLDDDQENIDAAQSVGIDARLYTSTVSLNI